MSRIGAGPSGHSISSSSFSHSSDDTIRNELMSRSGRKPRQRDRSEGAAARVQSHSSPHEARAYPERNEAERRVLERGTNTQQETIDTLDAALGKIEEAKAVGASTLGKLAQNHEALNTMDRDLDVTDESLQNSERTAKQMGSFGWLRSTFSRPTIFKSKRYKPAAPKRLPGLMRFAAVPTPPAAVRSAPSAPLKVPPKEIPAELVENETIIDHRLDAVGHGLSDLKELALDQNRAIAQQDAVLGHVDARTDRTHGTVKRVNARVQAID